MTETTKTDASVDDWSINDELVRLRAWAGDRMYPMPVGEGEHYIGSGDDCWVRLSHPDSLISRHHIALTRQQTKWLVRDVSKNGFKLDGVRVSEGVLTPGTEIWLAGTQLVAESQRLASLRGFLGRILGWKSSQNLAVDIALRAIRMSASRRVPLVLVGDDNLMSIARSLHRRFHDPDRPFVVCDPRRKRADENIRAAQNFDLGFPALVAAMRGTLCVWSQKLPKDWEATREMLALPETRVQLIVCSRDREGARAFGEPIVVPGLDTRPDEVARIVAEYVLDAGTELGVSNHVVSRTDHAWIAKGESGSLPQIETAALRLTALRQEEGNVARAARLLGMARMSLAEWIARRRLPIVTT